MDNNTLYIADTLNHRVVVIQPGSTNATAIIGSYGNASNQLDTPTDIFFTRTSVYILDGYNYRVQMWPKNGSSGITVAGVTGVSGAYPNVINFQYSFGIFIDKYGYLYVADYYNHRILRYPPNSTSGTSGVMVAGTGQLGSTPSRFNNPSKLFVDDDLTMYVADSANHRIQKWTYGACAGVTVAGNGTMGSSLSQLYNPYHVIVDANGFMFISELSNRRIVRWLLGAPTGECVAGCSRTAGLRADQLNSPHALAFDSNGLLYVSDTINNRVQRFSLFSTSRTYSTCYDMIVDEAEIMILQTLCLFSTTDSLAHGTMDTVSDHRRWISDGYSRKWIFDAVSQSRDPDSRQQHALHR